MSFLKRTSIELECQRPRYFGSVVDTCEVTSLVGFGFGWRKHICSCRHVAVKRFGLEDPMQAKEKKGITTRNSFVSHGVSCFEINHPFPSHKDRIESTVTSNGGLFLACSNSVASGSIGQQLSPPIPVFILYQQ